MAWLRPLLETLINRNQADIETSLPGADARTRRTNLNIIAKMVSATAHGLYGYLEYIAKQILPDTADSDYLDRHASLWLKEARKPAAFAVGQVILTGANGVVIQAGTILNRADGFEFGILSDAIIVNGTATAHPVAVLAGAAGNTPANTVLNLSSPIAGITNVVVAAGGISFGADVESDVSLRIRILARIQQPPHGGADYDYVAWALQVPGVTRAWIYPNELGLGTVTLRFLRDLDAIPIPDANEVAIVQSYVERLCPVTAKLTVVAPVAVPLDFTIHAVPNSLAVKAAIEAELRDLIQREAIPGGTIFLSHTREAISIAAGENNYTMAAPTTDIVLTTGQISSFGTITWN
jgi:uncharacterized phage protein gp47/JayE